MSIVDALMHAIPADLVRELEAAREARHGNEGREAILESLLRAKGADVPDDPRPPGPKERARLRC